MLKHCAAFTEITAVYRCAKCAEVRSSSATGFNGVQYLAIALTASAVLFPLLVSQWNVQLVEGISILACELLALYAAELPFDLFTLARNAARCTACHGPMLAQGSYFAPVSKPRWNQYASLCLFLALNAVAWFALRLPI